MGISGGLQTGEQQEEGPDVRRCLAGLRNSKKTSVAGAKRNGASWGEAASKAA